MLAETLFIVVRRTSNNAKSTWKKHEPSIGNYWGFAWTSQSMDVQWRPSCWRPAWTGPTAHSKIFTFEICSRKNGPVSHAWKPAQVAIDRQKTPPSMESVVGRCSFAHFCHISLPRSLATPSVNIVMIRLDQVGVNWKKTCNALPTSSFGKCRNDSAGLDVENVGSKGSVR